MSLNDVKLPFLRIRDLPEKFQVAVTGHASVTTKFSEDTMVLKVRLIEEQAPLVGTPPVNFLTLSNTAQSSLRKMGHQHLDELKNTIITFKKVQVRGFSAKTIEAVKVESW